MTRDFKITGLMLLALAVVGFICSLAWFAVIQADASEPAPGRYLFMTDSAGLTVNTALDDLPYEVTGSAYDDGWLVDDDMTLNYFVIDWQQRRVHQLYRTDSGQWLVIIWSDFSYSADGHPHPDAAYFVKFEFPERES